METAGLTDLLKQEGSYTIFAPTDDAFDGLNREDFELLKSEKSTETHTCPHTFMHLPFEEQDVCTDLKIYNAGMRREKYQEC